MFWSTSAHTDYSHKLEEGGQKKQLCKKGGTLTAPYKINTLCSRCRQHNYDVNADFTVTQILYPEQRIMGQLTSRQELINHELSNPAARDWLCVSLALRDATKALAASMHLWIARLHRQIKRGMPHLEACQQNCSQTCPDLHSWCHTCLAWQKEILSLCEPHYKAKVVWSRFRSVDWPANPYEVARVFISRAHRFYYKSNEFHEDIRFTLCFLENCAIIDVPGSLIQKAWVLRNSFRRRGRMRAKKRDMQQALSVLTTLLQVPQIAEHQAVGPVLQELKDLQNTADTRNGCTIL